MTKDYFGGWSFFKHEKLQELSRTVKTPYLADLERRVNPYK